MYDIEYKAPRVHMTRTQRECMGNSKDDKAMGRWNIKSRQIEKISVPDKLFS